MNTAAGKNIELTSGAYVGTIRSANYTYTLVRKIKTLSLRLVFDNLQTYALTNCGDPKDKLAAIGNDPKAKRFAKNTLETELLLATATDEDYRKGIRPLAKLIVGKTVGFNYVCRALMTEETGYISSFSIPTLSQVPAVPPPLLPPGTYTAEITYVDVQESKRGEPMLKLVPRLIGEYQGADIFDYIGLPIRTNVVRTYGQTASMQARLSNFLAAAKMPSTGGFTPSKLIGRQVQFEYKHVQMPDGRTMGSVARYLSPNDAIREPEYKWEIPNGMSLNVRDYFKQEFWESSPAFVSPAPAPAERVTRERTPTRKKQPKPQTSVLPTPGRRKINFDEMP